MSFTESKTHQNLKAAFAGESQANRRYTWMAQVAEKEGLPEVAALFKHSADGETGHALKHLMFLAAQAGDPATGMPLGNSLTNLKSAVAGETYEYTDMYLNSRVWPGKRAMWRSPPGSRPWPRSSASMRAASRTR